MSLVFDKVQSKGGCTYRLPRKETFLGVDGGY